MRLLGITETCDLGSLYLRLQAEGREVRVSVSEPMAAGTMAGMIDRTEDWRSELPWVRQAGNQGLILFEAVGFGTLQDELRKAGYNVIGGSAFGDRLENNRGFALRLLAEHGLRIADVAEFGSAQEAIDDLLARPRRCVFKMSASAGETFVGAMPDGRDVAALIASRRFESGERFVLMDHVEGVETGVGAYFDGQQFLRPACLDWEHKHFFAGNMGELTGEMGTIATYDGSEKLFGATLAPIAPLLREAGHVGYVNLNTIINADGVWPLEFTCRFGYPGFAVLEPLRAFGWGELFQRIIARSGEPIFPTHQGYSACVVLSTPPFPYSRKELDLPVGLPVLAGDVEPEHLHLGEVGMVAGQIVTSGLYGWTAVVTGTGPDIARAKAEAYRRAKLIQAPNLRYRLDIGDALLSGEYEQLKSWGWLS